MATTQTTTMGAINASVKMNSDRTFLGHPIGLFFLFFTEMWERFSYYGMRALLVLYMTKYLITHAQTGGYVFGFGILKAGLEGVFGPLAVQPLASQIYGLYTGFVYFTPFFGGILADRVFGQRKTVVLGGVLSYLATFLPEHVTKKIPLTVAWLLPWLAIPLLIWDLRQWWFHP